MWIELSSPCEVEEFRSLRVGIWRLTLGAKGVTDSRLGTCGTSPNCVSSAELRKAYRVPALAYEGSAAEAREGILKVLQAWPRTTIVRAGDYYILAECRSRWLGFVDDLEIFIDEKEERIQFRSASRVGYSDFGANRKRIQKLVDSLSISDGSSIS